MDSQFTAAWACWHVDLNNAAVQWGWTVETRPKSSFQISLTWQVSTESGELKLEIQSLVLYWIKTVCCRSKDHFHWTAPLYPPPVPRWSQKWGNIVGCAALVPHFSARKGEFAVTCCEQRRSAEVKPLSAGTPPRTSLGELTTLSQTPESNEEGTLALHSLASGPKGWIGTPTFYTKVTPLKVHHKMTTEQSQQCTYVQNRII